MMAVCSRTVAGTLRLLPTRVVETRLETGAEAAGGWVSDDEEDRAGEED